MKLSDFISGLQTLAPYYEDGDSYPLGAEHDIFYAYATKKPLTSEDVQKMVDLGWFQPDADTGDADDFEAKHYDKEESWAAYT